MLVIILIGAGMATVNQMSEQPSMLESYAIGAFSIGLALLVFFWGWMGWQGKGALSTGSHASGAENTSEPQILRPDGAVTSVEPMETVP